MDRDLLHSDYYFDGRDLYLKVGLYGPLFGLHMKFDFSLLRVLLPLDESFPAFQKLKRQKERKQLLEKKAALKDVLQLSRSRDYVAGGALDWRASTAPIGGGAQYFDLDFGAVVLGGDLTLSGGGSTRTGFDEDRLNYLWHYYFDNNKYITQGELGRIHTAGPIPRSLTGALVTNKPQIRRKYFQTIQVGGQPGPGWEVELYVDGRLVDYQETDASGRYDFNVDVYYGASNVEIKRYGPNAEIETEEQHFRIPFNLIPRNEIEYSAAIGQGRGRDNGRSFVEASAYYGLMSRVTAGVSADVPTDPLENQTPFYAFEATIQPATNFTLAGSASPDNRLMLDANYVWPSVVSFGAHAAKYYENEFTNALGQQYRWQFSISSPLRVFGRYLGLRYNITQDQYLTFGTTNMTYGINTAIKPVHFNYVGQYQVKRGDAGSVLASQLSSKIMGSIQFHRRFRPQFRLDYDHTNNEITRYGASLTKRLWRSGQLTLSYESSPASQFTTFLATLHFFTGLFESSNRTQVSSGRVNVTQMHQGSIRFDQHKTRFIFDRRRAVGYGTAVVRPFLDDNYNGRKDPNEQTIPGLKAKISGVSGQPRGDERTYYYDRLRPYDEYLVQIDQYSLDDPTLKPSNENYQVTLNPSVVTEIEVPIVTASEVSGSVKRQVGAGTAGLGGIRVQVFNISKDVLTEITTFNDGEYYFLGLLPGSYRAYVDPEQLKRGGYRSQPEAIEFDVKPVTGGLQIENISFLLIPATQANEQ
ncbi:MAG: carboxypeptidase-like regulatory domain-containing protein [Candidatus Zixiibacteriota bacterium]